MRRFESCRSRFAFFASCLRYSLYSHIRHSEWKSNFFAVHMCQVLRSTCHMAMHVQCMPATAGRPGRPPGGGALRLPVALRLAPHPGWQLQHCCSSCCQQTLIRKDITSCQPTRPRLSRCSRMRTVTVTAARCRTHAICVYSDVTSIDIDTNVDILDSLLSFLDPIQSTCVEASASIEALASKPASKLPRPDEC